MPESRRRLGKDYTGVVVGAEVVVEVEPSVVPAGNAAAVVAAVAVAFVANACSGRHNRSLRTMHFVLEVVSESGAAECSIVGCKRRLWLQLKVAELGAGQQLQSNTQNSPGVVLQEEGQEEEAAGGD